MRPPNTLWGTATIRPITTSSAAIYDAQRLATTRGLTQDHNRTLKYLFKGAALTASRYEPFKALYAGLLARGLRPELARLTVARKLAAITLPIWKKGEAFEVDKLIKHAA